MSAEDDFSYSNVLASPKARENRQSPKKQNPPQPVPKVRRPIPTLSTLATTDYRDQNISSIFDSNVGESKASFTPFSIFGSGKTRQAKANILEEKKNDLDNENPFDLAQLGIKVKDPNKKESNFLRRSCVVMLVLAALALFFGVPTAFILVSTAEKNAGDGSFCGSVDEDRRIRQTLAEIFPTRLDNPGVFFFGQVFTDCLPKDVFGDLSEENKLILQTLTTIELNAMGLVKIHPQAFDNPLLAQIENFDLSRNGLGELPEDLLKPMPRIRVLDLSRNGIGTLRGNFFLNIPDLEILFLVETAVTEIPRALSLAGEKLIRLDMTGCQSFVTFEDGVLSKAVNLESVIFTDSFQSFNLPQAEFRQRSGVPARCVVTGLNF